MSKGSSRARVGSRFVGALRTRRNLTLLARLQDSYVELHLNFSKDAKLRDLYVGGLAKIRTGRLLEDFDAAAGAAACKWFAPNYASVQIAGPLAAQEPCSLSRHS